MMFNEGVVNEKEAPSEVTPKSLVSPRRRDRWTSKLRQLSSPSCHQSSPATTPPFIHHLSILPDRSRISSFSRIDLQHFTSASDEPSRAQHHHQSCLRPQARTGRSTSRSLPTMRRKRRRSHHSQMSMYMHNSINRLRLLILVQRYPGSQNIWRRSLRRRSPEAGEGH